MHVKHVQCHCPLLVSPVVIAMISRDTPTARRLLTQIRLNNLMRCSPRPQFLYIALAFLGCLMLYSITFISAVYNPFSRNTVVAQTGSNFLADADTFIHGNSSLFDHILSANAVDMQFDTNNGLLDLSKNELLDMVSRTRGYYARDWSLGLGWNNVRYTVETSLHHAQLMNRTLILPSFFLARTCEHHIDVCARYARTVNRNDAVGLEEWRKLPLAQQQAFMIPFQVMVDIPYLRRQGHSVLLVSEYLHLQGLNRTKEISSGAWDRHYYHKGPANPSLFVIPNGEYDPSEIVRVDKLPALTSSATEGALVLSENGNLSNSTLSQAAVQKGKSILEWSDMKQALGFMVDTSDEIKLQRLLDEAGWVTLHTWQGAIGVDLTKDVVTPIRKVAPYTKLRGFIEDYANLDHDVVLLEGEIHLNRKPGSLYFTTVEGRDNFATIVLRDLQPSEEVRNLAKRIVKRMDSFNQGRHWVAAHMRRGDFVTIGWINEGTLQAHFKRIIARLEEGRKLLERLVGSSPERYNVPFSTASKTSKRNPPLRGDYVYLATDERSTESLELFRSKNAKVFRDLVTINDRRLFGWPLLYTDIVSQVEQQVIGTGAAYFYAHGMSSVAGGIMNIRAAAGWDSRTARLDG